MTDYSELVKALRGKFIAYDVTGNHNSAQLYKDAADAIEKLVTLYEKAEIDATNLTGKLAQAEAQLPKRGEWIWIQKANGGQYKGCSVCHAPIPTDSMLDYLDDEDCDFCYSCGAKMEVQE